MKSKLFIFIYLFCSFSFCQSIREDINSAIDQFEEEPSLKNIEILYKAEKKFNLSKDIKSNYEKLFLS